MNWSLLRYNGIDWLLAGLIILHLWMLGNKTRWAFLVGALASCVGLTFGYMVGSIASILMNSIFIMMHIRAFIKWSRNARLKGPRLAEETWPDSALQDCDERVTIP